MSATVWSVWDLDGCLSDCSARLGVLPDYERFHSLCANDPVREPEASLLRAWRWAEPREQRRVAILTGRTKRWERETDEWLNRNHLFGSVDLLLMRPNGDHCPSEVLKREMLDRLRANFSDARISFAVEDTPKLVAMYVALGVPVLQSISHRSRDVSTSEG